MQGTSCRRGRCGFTLVELEIVIAIIAIIAAIAIPNLLEARKGANESAAIGSLRTLVTTQSLFRDTDKDGDGLADYGTLQELLDAMLIDSVLASGTKQGYLFSVETTPAPGWTASADPASDETGTRHFWVSEAGVIRFNNAGPAGPGDPEIGAEPPPPTPQQQLNAEEREAEARSAILSLDGLGAGAALPAGVTLLDDPSVADVVLASLDQDASQTLELSEVLGADLLLLARSLVPVLVGDDPGPSLGADALAKGVADAYLQFLVVQLEPTAFNEDPEASVPTAGLPGDAQAFLTAVSAPLPTAGLLGGALGVLLAVILWPWLRRRALARAGARRQASSRPAARST